MWFAIRDASSTDARSLGAFHRFRLVNAFLRCITIAGIGALNGTPVSAQIMAAIDGTGSRITYADASGLSAASVSPTLEWLAPSASLAATGSFSQFAGGGWTLQGTAAGSVFTPPAAGFRGELAVAGVGSTSQNGSSAGEILGHSRRPRLPE
jgi:hypothetical protein